MERRRATSSLLSNLLIDKLSAAFRSVEIQGDGGIVFAPNVVVQDSKRLVDIIEACDAVFRLRLEQMVTNTSCECSVCRAPQTVPNGPSRGPQTGTPVRPQRHPSSTACPDHAKPCHARPPVMALECPKGVVRNCAPEGAALK